MRHKLRIIAIIVGAIIVIGATATDALSDDVTVEASIAAALARNYFLTLSAPAGTTNTETNPAYKEAAAAAPGSPGEAASAAAGDWPSYNRTLLGLVDDRDARCDLLLLDQPVQHGGRSIGRIGIVI